MEDLLDFGAVATQDVEDLGYDEPQISKEDQVSSKRYDEYPTLIEKRKALLADLCNNVLPEEEKEKLPIFFLSLVKSIPPGTIVKTDNGGFKIDLNKIQNAQQRQAFTKFISEGGDALASKAIGEVKKIVKDIAKEVMLHISAKNPVPQKTLFNMFKSGKIREIIDFYLKIHHYELFGPNWVNSLIQPILAEIQAIHYDEKQMALRESLKRVFETLI